MHWRLIVSAAVCDVVKLGSRGCGISLRRAVCSGGRLLFRQLLLAALPRRNLSRPFGRRLLSLSTRTHRASSPQRRWVRFRGTFASDSVRVEAFGRVWMPAPRVGRRLRLGVAEEHRDRLSLPLDGIDPPFLAGRCNDKIARDVAAAMRKEPSRRDHLSPRDENVRDGLDPEATDDQIPKPPGVPRTLEPFASLLAKVIEHPQQRKRIGLGLEHDHLTRVESHTQPLRRRLCDWRAAEALMNRIYGKPEQAIVARVPPNPAHEVIRSLSLGGKLELPRRLQGGDLDDASPALPMVEVGSPPG
jgi:hypothetical protein